VFPTDTDLAIGVVPVVTLIIVTTIEWGLIIPSLAILGLAYGYWGYLLDNELLNHGGLSFRRLVSYASIPSFRGALGDFAQISAHNLFMFMVFAGVLEATGGMDFIMRLSAAIGGRSRSGPAQVAVVSSGLQGMVSGSSVANVANVASSGVLTIPLMIKYGYSRPFAGAVEAVSSNGGQITPPVMSVAAFLMVGLTGIPYSDIATAAILAAVVYFAHCAFAVQIATLKQGIKGLSPDEAAALRGPFLGRDLIANAHLGLAVIFLMAALTDGLPEGNAALIATVTLLAVDVVKRLALGPGTAGERPRLTPNPALAIGADGRAIAFGTPGGDVQAQAMLQIFLNRIAYGMNPQAAVEAPRFGSYSFPDSFEPHSYLPARLALESRLPRGLADRLAGLGHDIEWWPEWTWKAGAVCLIDTEPATGLRHAGADPRRASYALGW
jgi:TRAP-type uncharacterized transport system fused permease subunit